MSGFRVKQLMFRFLGIYIVVNSFENWSERLEFAAQKFSLSLSPGYFSLRRGYIGFQNFAWDPM